MKKQVECIVKRGEHEESRHVINCIVIDEEKNILFQSGEINKGYCLRSTLKPFQSAASLKEGTADFYNFTDREIAVTCASHHSESEHINTVNSILNKIGLKDTDLECGFHFPLDGNTKKNLHSGKKRKSNIYNNCSGKHAGLLAFIQRMKHPVSNYINHTHPIHNKIKDYIADISEDKPRGYAVDGCSLPTPYFNLQTLATMYMKLITAQPKSELYIVLNAMRKNPQMVSGKKGFDTLFMKYFNNNAVSKGGAEGMQALALRSKKHGNISLALKVSDGNHRGNYISCISILRYLNIITESDYDACSSFSGATQKNLNKIDVGKLLCNIS